MRLASASSYFDRTECADAYAPTTKFKGQLNLYDDSMRDGTTVARRVLSVADGVTIPARRAITVHDDVYLVGAAHKDSFDGSVLRVKYVLHLADGLAVRYTPDQLLRSLSGYSLYASRLWVKDLKELEVSSRLESFMNLYTSATETVSQGSIILLSGRYHLVRNFFKGAAGLQVCEVDELSSDCLVTASYSGRAGQAYNPATDLVGSATVTAPKMLWHRWQNNFFYRRQAADKFEEGDVVAYVSTTNVATAQAGDNFTINSITYSVLSATADGLGAWVLHGRPD